MPSTRRDFVATGLAGLAGACAAGAMTPECLLAGDVAARQPARASEDGYKLWLRYVSPGAAATAYRRAITQVIVEGTSPTSAVIKSEMSAALESLLGATVPVAATGLRDNAVVIGTPANSPAIRGLGLEAQLKQAGPEGYVIRTGRSSNHPVVVIASSGEIGALYGTFHFLRLLQTGASIDGVNVTEQPKVQLRLLNHWDNLDGTIERGYAGGSLWQWSELPATISPRYADYARANASIGINGAVVNSVNADVLVLSPEYCSKVAARPNVFRPYGVRM